MTCAYRRTYASRAGSGARSSGTTARRRRALHALQGDVARRRYRPLEEIGFDVYADRWLAGFTGKANSRRVYATTIDYAKAIFGKTKVRDLDASDVRRFLDAIRAANAPRKVSPATLAKHLHQLGACLEAAISEGYGSATRSASCTRRLGRRWRGDGPPTTPTTSSRGSGRSSPTGPST